MAYSTGAFSNVLTPNHCIFGSWRLLPATGTGVRSFLL